MSENTALLPTQLGTEYNIHNKNACHYVRSEPGETICHPHHIFPITSRYLHSLFLLFSVIPQKILFAYLLSQYTSVAFVNNK
jgi:hypothetical protein